MFKIPVADAYRIETKPWRRYGFDLGPFYVELGMRRDCFQGYVELGASYHGLGCAWTTHGFTFDRH